MRTTYLLMEIASGEERVLDDSRDVEELYAIRDKLAASALASGLSLSDKRYAVRPA